MCDLILKMQYHIFNKFVFCATVFEHSNFVDNEIISIMKSIIILLNGSDLPLLKVNFCNNYLSLSVETEVES